MHVLGDDLGLVAPLTFRRVLWSASTAYPSRSATCLQITVKAKQSVRQLLLDLRVKLVVRPDGRVEVTGLLLAFTMEKELPDEATYGGPMKIMV